MPADVTSSSVVRRQRLVQRRKALGLTQEALAELVGYYELAPACIIAVTRDGDLLFAQPIDEKDQIPYPIFQYGEREFFYTAFAGQLTFLGSRDGAATALILHQNGLDQHAKRTD